MGMKITHLENVSRSHIIKLALTLTTILIVFFFYSSHHWDQNGCSLKRWNLICMNTSEMEPGRWSYMYHTVNKYQVNQMFFMQEKKQPIPRKDKNIISIQSHTVAYEQASP